MGVAYHDHVLDKLVECERPADTLELQSLQIAGLLEACQRAKYWFEAESLDYRLKGVINNEVETLLVYLSAAIARATAAPKE